MNQISLLDRVSSTVTNNFKFFSEGVGDRKFLENIQSITSSIVPISEIKIEWGLEKNILFADSIEGKFLSPNQKELPEESKFANFLFVKPKNFSKNTPIVVHLAATGEEGFTKRLFTMALPLTRSGIASVILENSYYGNRKPLNQKSYLVKTFSDFFKMTSSTVEEGKSLLNYFYELGHKKLAITGVSMGGSLAAIIGSTCRLPIGVVPCLAGHSPAPIFTEALLFDSIDWSALKKEFIDLSTPLKYVKEILEKADIRNLPIPVKPRACILVGAERDGIVLPYSIELIQEHWKNSELRWIDSGHAGSFLFHTGAFRKAIRDSLDRL